MDRKLFAAQEKHEVNYVRTLARGWLDRTDRSLTYQVKMPVSSLRRLCKAVLKLSKP